MVRNVYLEVWTDQNTLGSELIIYETKNIWSAFDKCTLTERAMSDMKLKKVTQLNGQSWNLAVIYKHARGHN